MKKIWVMFICAGNICRSPMAEAVFRHMVAKKGLEDRFEIQSSGTGHWHVGKPPHFGTRKILAEHSIQTGDKRAQLLKIEDFNDFDYLIAMDTENVEDIRYLFGKNVKRLLEFAEEKTKLNVPDPYYENNFEEVYELVTSGCAGLLNFILDKEFS